jgi:hypothetical protein
VLMDLQYAPWVLASACTSATGAIIPDIAKQERVGLFSRFALMRNSNFLELRKARLCPGIHCTILPTGMIALVEPLPAISNSAR